MTALELFRFPETGQQVRAFEIDGSPWFVAADVCAVLGIGNPSQAVSYLDEDERTTTLITSEGGQQRTVNIINEPGLYSLILRSRKPEAKAFKRWITHEVLPEIRKTGSYAGREITRKELAYMVIEAEERAELEAARADRAERRANELEPAAHAWDVLASAHGDYSVREAAFMLNRDPSISTGQKRLFQALRDLRLIDSRDIPYAAHERHVTLRSRHYEHPHTREARVTQQVRITVDGLRYLHKRLGGSAPFSSLIGEAA
ncbi:phage antirepressor [Microbispora amethystogenes]|uniref:phage antirepressor n=1 Tax=Microbispora amethystogenes TaxID=1427754 RepID=UPI0033D8245C